MDTDTIITSDPVDKTAAIVVSGNKQSVCPTPTEIRENLVTKLKKVRDEIITLPKHNNRRKKLALEQRRIEKEIHKIKPTLKHDNEFNNILLDIIRPDINKVTWDRYVKQAIEIQKNRS